MSSVTQCEKAIDLDETGYGSGQHAVIVLMADTKQELVKEVASRRYARTHDGDRPGQLFATGLKVIKYIQGDHCWQAVCIASFYYDV